MQFKKSDVAYLRAQNNKKPVENPPQLISEYMNGRRRIPDGTPYPGKYDIHRTPYAIEPLDNMSPFSGIKNTVVMKSVQSGFTTNLGENVIGFYIGARPAKLMYMSGTDGLLKKFLNGRFDPLIDSCGFRDLIQSQSLKKHNRKTGDTSEYKEFPGGTASFGSLQSEASMRQESIMIMIRDEIGLIRMQMSSGEGNPLKVSDGRTVAFDETGRVKILDYSTPGISGDCLIELQYNKGDKRKYMVKCPLCGKRQYFSMGDDKSNYGLKGDYKRGKLINAHYLCFHCHDAIFNHQKFDMLQTGIWEPTAQSISRDFRSYLFPAFYSPMLNWLTIRKEYDEAQETDGGMKSFTNLYLAEAYVPTGERPDLSTVIEIRSNRKTGYKSGTVPKDILFLTMSADLQRGKDKWAKYSTEEINGIVKRYADKKQFEKIDAQHFPRIEVEVCGHGRDHRTASIIYKKFYGQLSDHTSGAWKKLTEWINADIEGLKFYRDDGFAFSPEVFFIDSGWKPNEKFINVAYSYCQGKANTYPIKGAPSYKTDKQEQYDITPSGQSDIKRFKRSETSEYGLVIIQGVYYKEWIYRNFKNNDPKSERQPPNTHITPYDYPDSYYEALRAEKQKAEDGSFHNEKNKANEAFDLLVYNKCGRDLHMQNLVITLQAIAIQNQPGLANYKKDYKIREKLNQVAGEKQAIKNMERRLRHNGWGPELTSEQYDELYN